jgi:hypothetical protein
MKGLDCPSSIWGNVMKKVKSVVNQAMTWFKEDNFAVEGAVILLVGLASLPFVFH